MLYDELLDYLQNLIQAKVTQEEIGNALNVSKQAIAKNLLQVWGTDTDLKIDKPVYDIEFELI